MLGVELKILSVKTIVLMSTSCHIQVGKEAR